MKNTKEPEVGIAKMTFASVYPKDELHQIIEWLTGYTESELEKQIEVKADFERFYQSATLNPNARLITGMICGYRVEESEHPLTQKVRYLDKLVDELAKGRKIEKILRVE